MAHDDWYKDQEWNEDVEAKYRAKLSRSRNGRPNYLWCQASLLAEKHPAVALGLIDEYFDTKDEYNVPNALCVRAKAYLSLGNLAQAILAYKAALDWEKKHPLRLSFARLHLPKLIADHRISDEYDYALDILNSRFKASDLLLFAENRYQWNGISALIAHERGQILEAREFAKKAIMAAMETESSFRYHPAAGIVNNTSDGFGQRLRQIAKPSKFRSWIRLFSKGSG